MDEDLYYKYSELWLIKHSTSLLCHCDIVNNRREVDSQVKKHRLRRVRSALGVTSGAGGAVLPEVNQGAASLVDESFLTEKWMHHAFS